MYLPDNRALFFCIIYGTIERLFYSSLDTENVGKYRTYQVLITGTVYLPPEASEVPALMEAFISELNDKSKTD